MLRCHYRSRPLRSMNPHTTLITGSTHGIGLHLAHEFARNRHELVLVGPVEGDLDSLADALSEEHGIHVEYLAKDLTRAEAPEEIFADLQQRDIQIEILVNNAGSRAEGMAWQLPIEGEIASVRLNIEAVLWLTNLCLASMLQRQRGRILNVTGVAVPEPVLAVHHATDAFIRSWAEALAVELEDTPITITTLCAGPVDLDLFAKAALRENLAFDEPCLREVAKIAYQGLMNGELFVNASAENWSSAKAW